MWLDTTLTIASAGTASPELNVTSIFPVARLCLVILAPGTLSESVTIQVAKQTGGTYAVLQSGGSDITLPAGKATTINPLSVGALKLVAGGAVAADRTFTILASPIR